MKNYTITVNGTTYSVQVEEGASTASAPVAAAPKAAPAAAPKAAPAAAPAGAQGSVKIECQSAGKVLSVSCTMGQAVKKGDTVLVLESMKMEIPVVAPEDGTVASIDCAVGDAVEQGATLATLN